MELYQILLLVFGAIALIAVILAFVLKKDYMKYSQIISPILLALLKVLRAVNGLVPSNEILTTIVTVLSAAIEAAGYAETLWLSGTIDKGARPDCAKQYILNILEKAGITITDNIQTIITGTIALTCYLMPHHNEVIGE